MHASSSKTGIVLLNMGGPDRLESVKPFLYNLFSDPDIIRLPLSALFQKPLAWYIATRREKEAQENYALMGGASPILQFSQAQAELLKAELQARGYDVETYVAMRYWHPFTEATVARMRQDGIERLVALPLYPHFSYTTSGSSLNALKRGMQQQGFAPPVSVVPHYFDHPVYLKALAETIETGLSQNDWTCPREEVHLLFSAHSLPVKHVQRTQDPYPEQIRATAEQVMQAYFPKHRWDLSFQSQVGKMPWLGPYTDGVIPYFAGKRMDNILMVAISFVSDHVETLVEIDRQYIPLANELGITRCYRAPALNTSPTFIQALTALSIAELDKPAEANPLRLPDAQELLPARQQG